MLHILSFFRIISHLIISVNALAGLHLFCCDFAPDFVSNFVSGKTGSTRASKSQITLNMFWQWMKRLHLDSWVLDIAYDTEIHMEIHISMYYLVFHRLFGSVFCQKCWNRERARTKAEKEIPGRQTVPHMSAAKNVSKVTTFSQQWLKNKHKIYSEELYPLHSIFILAISRILKLSKAVWTLQKPLCLPPAVVPLQLWEESFIWAGESVQQRLNVLPSGYLHQNQEHECRAGNDFKDSLRSKIPPGIQM